jgi:hypothetical protein
MERYELQFYILFVGSILILIILLFGVMKIKVKTQKRLPILITLYFLLGFASTILYAIICYISWQIPTEISYEVQVFLWAIVFCCNIIGTIFLGEFINEIFYKNNQKFRAYYLIFGLILFGILLLGGILGYSHEPVPGPPNNNDLKIEYYMLYNLYYVPIILTGLIKTARLLSKSEISPSYKRLLRYVAGLFSTLSIIFFFGLLDGFDGTSYVFTILAISMIPLSCFFAYMGFFGETPTKE